MNRKLFFRLLLVPALAMCALSFTSVPSVKSSRPPEHVVLASLDETKFMPNNDADPNLYILLDGDVIMMSKGTDVRVPADSVDMTLVSAPNITSRKDIYVPSGDRQFENDHSAGIGDTDNEYLRGCCIHSSGGRFRAKVWDIQRYGVMFAKQNGIDLGMHELPPFARGSARPRDDRDTDVYNYRPSHPNELGGQFIIFKWIADNWPQREKGLKFSDFMPRNRRPLSDGDLIILTQESPTIVGARVSVPSDRIDISLQTDPDVTWWKEIKLRLWTIAPDGRLVEPHTDMMRIELQDRNHGPISSQVNKYDFYRRGQLIFSKAKFLGVHTEIYKMWGSEFKQSPSNLFTFTWHKD